MIGTCQPAKGVPASRLTVSQSALMKSQLKGISTVDNKIEDFTHSSKTASMIFKLNVNHMDRAEVILASLSPFRGLSMDAGTISELAYAAAKEKLVIGYFEGECAFHRACCSVLQGRDEWSADWDQN
jgi:nucleoside 2-deoxyribosyltransferase